MRVATFALLASLTLTALGGCGRDQEASTPTACLAGPGAYAAALQAAPGEVRLGGVALSECLPANQAGGDLATVGGAMVVAATRLNGEARADPGGPAAVRLGYLLGAAQRGADAGEGIHSDLIRRLTVAARFSPEGPLPAGFLPAYRRGYDAGRANG